MLQVTRGIGAEGRTRTQSLFSVFAPPSPPPAWLLGDSHYTNLFTSTSYKGEGLLLWKTKNSSKKHKEKSTAGGCLRERLATIPGTGRGV